MNLPNPLRAIDELQVSKKPLRKTIRVTAGLHRQTWISGYPVFIDIHIENESSKAVRRVDLQLEKTVLFYKYSAPSTGTRTADILRLPDYLNKETIVSKVLLDGFQGVRPLSEDFRTCQLALPAGLVSIETGRFFGIRFFIHVQITISFNNHLKVQLPITIVHPNSIDIPPNALAQVAAAVEQKHRDLSTTSGSPYRYRAGQAFHAARRQSYLQLRKDTVGSREMEDLTRALESSPRREPRRLNGSPKKLRVKRRQSAVVLGGTNRGDHQHLRTRSSFDSLRYNTYTLPRPSFETVRPGESRPSLEQHASRAPRSSLETRVINGLRGSLESRGPGLQRSTSGLAFDDSDKENHAPRR